MPLIIAQFSDSHLFADIDGLHHGANVFSHLKKVLASIANNPTINSAVFTGDLTQDHSKQSYINFAEAVQSEKVTVPVYFLAGNHDEPILLNEYLSEKPFNQSKIIDCEHWQIQLVNSKSETPAGVVSQQTLKVLSDLAHNNNSKYQLIMMHHHPIDVGYFIDEHGLQNKDQFWRVINTCNNQNRSIKAIACGHVHKASVITAENASTIATKELASVDLYTCPATSIQFDPNAEKVSALAEGPAYRLFYLYPNGTLRSEIVHV